MWLTFWGFGRTRWRATKPHRSQQVRMQTGPVAWLSLFWVYIYIYICDHWATVAPHTRHVHYWLRIWQMSMRFTALTACWLKWVSFLQIYSLITEAMVCLTVSKRNKPLSKHYNSALFNKKPYTFSMAQFTNTPVNLHFKDHVNKTGRFSSKHPSSTAYLG